MAEASASIKRGPYKPGLRRREQIVEAASRVFAEFGYAGGSIRTIAAGVGVSPATLLQHFGSKEGLLEAVLTHWESEVEVYAPLNERGMAYLLATREFIQFHLKHRGLIELFLTLAAESTSPSHPAHDYFARRYERSLGLVATKFSEAAQDGDLRPLTPAEAEVEARLMFAMLDGLELQWLLDATVDLAGLYEVNLAHTLQRLAPEQVRAAPPWGAASSAPTSVGTTP